VLAALGLVVSPRRRDVQRTVMLTGDRPDVETIVSELADRARSGLGEPGAQIYTTFELRYRGQAFELPIKARLDDLREAFEAAHEERYGYRDPEGELELVTVRVTATVPGADVELEASSPESSTRSVIPLPESTVYVPAGWSAQTDGYGTVRLHHAR
jgi:N-methylhydantoinase A/oxoprolinase/acetone carboxylase beta subunit